MQQPANASASPTKSARGEMNLSKAECLADPFMGSRPSEQQLEHAPGHRQRVKEKQPAHIDEQQGQGPAGKTITGKPVGDQAPGPSADIAVIGTNGQAGSVVEAPEEEIQSSTVPQAADAEG